ncbi:MAG: TIGR03032 family protein [Pseudomonadota bacterium]
MTSNGSETDAQPDAPRGLEPANISCSRGLSTWLATNQISLALSSYQTGRLYLVGSRPTGQVNFHEIGIGRAMGLWADPQRLIVATQNQVVRFENVLASNQRLGEADKHYVPRVAHTTGDLDIHDIVVLQNGVIVFANTLFSCLSTLHNTHSFTPYWAPPFISKLAAEDRCHLNGIAMRDGMPAYVTATSRADVVNGWRARREQGGCIIDVQENAIITEKLSMPHSPRWHDGRLWVLNSGTGHLGTVNMATGTFEPFAFMPGFVRGLAFHNNHAIVGLSLPRDGTFSGLQLDEELSKRDADPWCGIQIVSLASGDIVEWIRFESAITELLDVCILPGVRLPSAYAPTSPELTKFFTFDPGPSAERAAE